MSKKVVIGGVVALAVAFLVWLFMISNKPLPGVEELQNSRNHLPVGTKIDYKFNPPTSGDHYPVWITKGFYAEPRGDSYLVHSQEHGYIIFWYDCEKKVVSRQSSVVRLLMPEVFAQSLPMTGGSEGSASAKLSELPKAFSDGSCDNLKDQIKASIVKNGQHKLIAVPRVGMDSPLILTAWGRAEKFTTVDSGKIKEFISAFRDNGPEQTNEP